MIMPLCPEWFLSMGCKNYPCCTKGRRVVKAFKNFPKPHHELGVKAAHKALHSWLPPPHAPPSSSLANPCLSSDAFCSRT